MDEKDAGNHQSNERFQDKNSNIKKGQYGIPDGYNPDEHPPVIMRNRNSSDESETKRKRRSKNRLSNRRSTGFVSPEMVDEAMRMGGNKTSGN